MKNLRNNKRYSLFLLLLALVIVGCNSGKQSKEASTADFIDVSSPLPKVFFKKFQGTLSTGQIIILYITRNTNSNDGDTLFHYVIESGYEEVPESGITNLKPDSSFAINIYGYQHDSTYSILSGHFLSGAIIKANFFVQKLKSNDSIQLLEVKSPIEVFPINYYNSKTEIADSANRGGMCDTFESTISLDILTFKSNDRAVDKLNRLLDFYLQFDKHLKEKYIPESGQEWASTSIIYFEDRIITVEVSQGGYQCGAAHGMYGYCYCNYDLEKGDTISLTDIIPASSFNKLETICEQKYKKENADWLNGDIWHFYLTRNYALLRKGLLFRYQPYEIGPYSAGAIEVFVPYSEIYGLMNSNSEVVKRIFR